MVNIHHHEIPTNECGEPIRNPEIIFKSVVNAGRNVIKESKINPKEIISLGISNQRVTFTSWERDTGESLHDFIEWSDSIGSEVCDSANSNIFTILVRKVCHVLYWFTGSPKFLTASRLNIKNNQTGPKMCYVMKYNQRVRDCHKRNNLCVGTIDSWLVWKLTGHTVHATDISNASATGFYDPYKLYWSDLISFLLYPYKLPPWSSMPKIKDTIDDFGVTSEDIFGVPIPIRAVVADQQASLFAQCCFNHGQMKATLGTGMFTGMSTGSKPRASYGGLYPLVAWKLGNEITWKMEGSENSAGMLIDWMKEINFIDHYDSIEEVFRTTEDSKGVIFIPSLSGLGSPFYNVHARGTFFGLTQQTRKNHMIRAMIESFGYRMNDIVSTFKKELLSKNEKIESIKVDGGVSMNDTICQVIADFTNIKVERPKNIEMSCLGAAYLAGLNSGVWKTKDDIKQLYQVDKVFYPSMDPKVRKKKLSLWKDAIQRLDNFPIYEESNYNNADEVNKKILNRKRFSFMKKICFPVLIISIALYYINILVNFKS